MKKIDENVKPIVKFVNECDGLIVVGSCGGHKNNKPEQAKEGHFYVDFIGPLEDVNAFVVFLSECEDVDSLEVVMKATLVSEVFYRLQGTLDDIECILPEASSLEMK